MTILKTLLEMWEHYRRERAEREALRLLVARGDRRLLRDAGLMLTERDRCEPLPQAKERRWTAPLIRLPPPSPRKRGEGDGAPFSQNNGPREEGKDLGWFPSPRLRGEGGRQAG